MEQIAAARAAVSGYGADEWLKHLDQSTSTAQTLRAQLPDLAPAASLSGHRPALSVRITIDRSRPWQPLAHRNLRWLLGQWRLGFPDANHVMSFPGMPDPGPHYGNVFSRTLLANALAEADRTVADGQLAPCLNIEAEHLLAHRRTGEPGLWAYFPTLTELPCDADDLAEAVRFLHRTGRTEALAPELATALAVAFIDRARPDGSFDTWLIPREKSAQWAAQQLTAAKELRGEGADPEVVANLLHAVAEYAPRRYHEALERGVGYLLSTQGADGSWPSSWYQGWLYSTYQCIRTITLLRPAAADALERAQERVLAAQSDDGGWGNSGDTSDPLGSALALLALAQAQERGLSRAGDREEAVGRAHRWLTENIGTDGSFREEPFIAMTSQRFPGLGAALDFGCPSITTALAFQAAITWDRLS